jgi:hypothetical protein
MCTALRSENSEGSYHCECVCVDRIILKSIFTEIGCEQVKWRELVQGIAQ